MINGELKCCYFLRINTETVFSNEADAWNVERKKGKNEVFENIASFDRYYYFTYQQQ